MIKSDYLTEENLGLVLQKLFPKCTIERQKLMYGRKIDFVIDVEVEDEHKIKELFNTTDDIKLLIEFDGYHHYSKTSQINKDKKVGLGFCKWNKIDEGIYGLRIPYFVQLDKRMTKVWFNIDEQMNEYPHGFISKVCKLTDEFVWGGEKRFIKELRILPKSVSKEIIESLLKRFKNPVDIISDINIEIFIKEFLPELYDQYKDEINSLKDVI